MKRIYAACEKCSQMVERFTLFNGVCEQCRETPESTPVRDGWVGLLMLIIIILATIAAAICAYVIEEDPTSVISAKPFRVYAGYHDYQEFTERN